MQSSFSSQQWDEAVRIEKSLDKSSSLSQAERDLLDKYRELIYKANDNTSKESLIGLSENELWGYLHPIQQTKILSLMTTKSTGLEEVTKIVEKASELAYYDIKYQVFEKVIKHPKLSNDLVDKIRLLDFKSTDIEFLMLANLVGIENISKEQIIKIADYVHQSSVPERKGIVRYSIFEKAKRCNEEDRLELFKILINQAKKDQLTEQSAKHPNCNWPWMLNRIFEATKEFNNKTYSVEIYDTITSFINSLHKPQMYPICEFLRDQSIENSAFYKTQNNSNTFANMIQNQNGVDGQGINM